MFGRRKVAALVAEFVGTYILASVVLALSTRTPFPFFAAVAAGLTLALAVLTFGSASGAHLNPAVTIGLWTLRKVQATQAIVYIAAQMAAGFVAFAVGQQLLGSQVHNIAGANVDWRVIAAEAIGACILGLGVAAAIYQLQDAARVAATVGLALMMGIIIASLGGNALINPAVALGVHSWSTSYVIGPIIGTVVGINLYAVLFLEDSPSTKLKKR